MVNLRTVIGTVSVTACVPYGTQAQLENLKMFFDAERARARTLSMASTEGLSRREASARRTLWEEQKEQLRRRGQLTDSLVALVIGGLCREIEAREWNRDWPDVPRQTRGRWPGSPQGEWPEEVSVRLPADLVQTVRAACWHTCRKEIGLLYAWREQHPKARPTCPSRPRCDAAALNEYKELASKIITTGEIWRAAVARGIGTDRPT